MKVLHVIPSMAVAHGGPSRAMRMFEEALSKKGVFTETASTDDDGASGRTGCASGKLLVEDGARRRYFRKTLHGYKVSVHFAYWILRHARRYDVIHIHALFSFTSTASAVAAWLANVPYVVRPLGTLGGYGMQNRRPWLKRLSLTFLEGPILRRAAAVHFTSEAEVAEVGALSIDMRKVLVPLAVDTGMFQRDVALPERLREAIPSRRYVLYLSRLDPVKNVEGLLDAIAICHGSVPNVKWLIAGSGRSSYVSTLQHRASVLGIADRVIWAGELHGEEKAAAFAHADLFVLPSFSENFGIAVVEALSAGLPVVLSKGVGVSKQVALAKAGKVVDPNPHAIASAMMEYLLDPSAREIAKQNAKRVVREQFSMERMGEELANLYRTILRGATVPLGNSSEG